MAEQEIRVTLKTFAQLRELRGVESEDFVLPAQTSVAQLFDQVFGAGPLAELPVAFALNHALVPPNTPLKDGDTLALLPPVGGG